MSVTTSRAHTQPGPGPKTRGRPPKVPGDDRPPRSVAFPTQHRLLYAREADELGIPFSSYVTLLAARGRGLPVPDYVLLDLEKAKQKTEDAAVQAATQETLDPAMDNVADLPDLEDFTASLREAS